MAVSAAAAATDPGETAVRFLEKIRAGKVDLSPGGDTALAPSTGEAKRKEIARRLDRMAGDLDDGPLEIGEVKMDGNLAGALVREIGGFDPTRMHVFAIALVKRGEAWSAAPVPASFENTGMGYAAGLRERLAALEDWMLRRQVSDLAELRDQSLVRMRRKIEESLPSAALRKLDPKQAAERFLQACAERNEAEILGLLGGLSADLPGDWPTRIKSVEQAISANSSVAVPWRLLCSPDVLRVIVHDEEDGKSGLVSLACLDPAGDLAEGSRPRVRLVHLDFSKSNDGLWRINPPGYFLQNGEMPDDASAEDLDSDLFDAFPRRLRELAPLSPQPTAEAARKALMFALQNENLTSLVRLIRLDGKPVDAREACARAASLWWAIREPSSVRLAVPLGLREGNENAVAAFQVFSARNPDRFDLKALYFENSPGGWLWSPKPVERIVHESEDWLAAQTDPWRSTWQEQLLAECPVLHKAPQEPAPSEEACRKLAAAWLKAIRSRDIPGTLRLSARLNLPDSGATLLRNLGYEFVGTLKQPSAPAITSVQRDKLWAAVATRDDSGDKAVFPLYPVVMTEAGPRILPEIDLAEAGTRSRDFLNKTSLKRLASFSAAAAETLRNLFERHRSEVAGKSNP